VTLGDLTLSGPVLQALQLMSHRTRSTRLPCLQRRLRQQAMAHGPDLSDACGHARI